MTPDQINNLRVTIQKTYALSSYEKNEWLGLLDLMDDRQLGELKKILEKAGARFVESKKPTEPPKPIIPSAQMPKLGHILNMPRMVKDEPSNTKTPQTPPTPLALPVIDKKILLPVVAPPEVKKAPSKFMQRIKDILAEKELPAPKKVEPLEIAAPAFKKPEPTTFGLKTFPLPPAKKPIAPLPKIEPMLKPKPTAVVPKQKSNISPTAGAGPQSGIAFGRSSEKDKEKILEEIKKHLENNKNQQPMQISINAQNVNIVSGALDISQLEDLANLTPKIFKNPDYNSIVRKIKDLVIKEGYHYVVFNIEKSPLYSNYIKTGAEILNNKINFESLGEDAPEGYLNKQDFESCADLLRRIQA